MSQFIGDIIAAVVRIPKYRRGAEIPSNGRFIPKDIWYATYLPCHAVIEESYEFSAEATQYPIENGALYSDHVIIKPIRFNVTLEVSNYDGLGKDAKWARRAMIVFQQLFEERRPLDLVTTHTLLPNMIMLSFFPSNTAPDWGKLTIRTTFQQVQQATFETQRFSDDKVIQGEIGTNSTKPLGPKTELSVQQKKAVGKKAVAVAATKAAAMSPLSKELSKRILGM